MAIFTRDLKGMMDLENDARLAEYEIKRRRAAGDVRSSDKSVDDQAKTFLKAFT